MPPFLKNNYSIAATKRLLKMLDSYIRPVVDIPLIRLAKFLHRSGISANALTAAGGIMAICAFMALAAQSYIVAVSFIVLNRLMDGLDGLVARQTKATDIGGYLDIVIDFIFYSGCIFFFALGRPEDALYAAFLIFSFIGTGSSFLAYAILSEKRKDKERGAKSFKYLSGLTEGTETFALLVAMCFFPSHFYWLAIVFGLMCWVTTYGRVKYSISTFS